MTFPSLLRALRTSWLTLTAGAVVGALVALAITLLTPNEYASTSSLYVSAYDDSRSAQSAYQGNLLSQQRVKSYTELLVSNRVLQPVADRLGIDEPVEDLAEDVAVGSTTDSTILTVSVVDRSPARAADIANGISSRFIEVVGELERPPDSKVPSVTVNTIDTARPDLSPVSPRLWVNLVVGLVVGLVAAAGVSLVRGSLDTAIRTTDDLAEVTGAPSLGSVPVSTDSAGGAHLPAPRPDTPHAEAFRRIRTNMLFADVDEPPTTLVVTSSAEGEGKTTLVMSLAAALSQTGRVAIVEGDLRRPTIGERLGLPAPVGFTDVLARRVELDRAMQRWGQVDVLLCGTPPPNPNELLSSRYAREVLDQLGETYDTVLVDSPPLGPVSDAALLGRMADGVLLVCRVGTTSRSQLQASVEALSQVGAHVTGTVLSMTDPEPHGYYGYRTMIGNEREPAGRR